ncbi:TetR/AcrR family transcriptional regulator [Streptomyces sp. NPDC007088]|uniref:TetR/AcrR family transcriptional regulator n=1 Tax=Streptomyces sp. NPDC007088 TaxID=3364773 RepID=UPI003688BEC2
MSTAHRDGKTRPTAPTRPEETTEGGEAAGAAEPSSRPAGGRGRGTAGGARARAREEITAVIKDEARRQLAAEGAAKLSLRAVAREIGMVSSALYRYFPSRDELLTALIIDAYNALGAAGEEADRSFVNRLEEAGEAAGSTAGPDGGLFPAALADSDPAYRTAVVGRWVAVCRAVREWALARPQEYALLYGSPVPGYTAPTATVGPASRIGVLLVDIVREGRRTTGLSVQPLPASLAAEARRLADDLAPDLPPAVVMPMVAAWAQLFGLVSFEVFGQFNRVVESREDFFVRSVAALAASVGLVAPREGAGAAGTIPAP